MNYFDLGVQEKGFSCVQLVEENLIVAGENGICLFNFNEEEKEAEIMNENREIAISQMLFWEENELFICLEKD